ncbi:unnamed protein product, partial [Cladocopium goreaui]
EQILAEPRTPEAMTPTTAPETPQRVQLGGQDLALEMLEEPEPVLQMQAEAEAEMSGKGFQLTPSVGTWFQRQIFLQELEVPNEDPPARADEVEAEMSGKGFQLTPSVGTWFQRQIFLQELEVPNEDPPARADEVEEQPEWEHGCDQETPVSPEETHWRALQAFEVRQYAAYPRTHLTGEIINARQIVLVTHKIWKENGHHFLKLASGGYVFIRNRSNTCLFERAGASELQPRADPQAGRRVWQDGRNRGDDNGHQWPRDGEARATWGHQREWPAETNKSWPRNGEGAPECGAKARHALNARWPRNGEGQASWGHQREWPAETNKSWPRNGEAQEAQASWGHQPGWPAAEKNKPSNWNSWDQWEQWEQRQGSPDSSNLQPFRAYPDPNDPKYHVDWDAFAAEWQEHERAVNARA